MTGNDALSAVAELAASQHGAFNRKQAASNNITARQLRRARDSGRLRHPLSDVFVFSSHRQTFGQRCVVMSLAGAVVSHRSAAVLHGLDGFSSLSIRGIDVCFERDGVRHLDGANVHTWSNTSPQDLAMVDGVRCTSIARTLFQLGSVASRDQVELALDSALRIGARADWIEETARRLHRPGPTGGRVLVDLMYDPARRGELSESVLERVIERLLTLTDMPPLSRQHVVETAAGPRRLDLACAPARLGIEGHSRRHHFGPAKESADATRDLHLAAAGWEVIYVTWALAHDPDTLLPLVRQTVESRLRSVG